MAFCEKYLYIKKSILPGSGQGLFIKKMIAKHTRIVEYKGKVRTWKEVKKIRGACNEYIFYIHSKCCIDAQRNKKALGRYANDAKGIVRLTGIKTNAEYVVDQGRCYLEATKNIAKESEIFVEYGIDYWNVVRDNLKIERREKKA